MGPWWAHVSMMAISVETMGWNKHLEVPGFSSIDWVAVMCKALCQMKQELSKCLHLGWFKEGLLSNHFRDLSLLFKYDGLCSSQRSFHQITFFFFFKISSSSAVSTWLWFYIIWLFQSSVCAYLFCPILCLLHSSSNPRSVCTWFFLPGIVLCSPPLLTFSVTFYLPFRSCFRHLFFWKASVTISIFALTDGLGNPLNIATSPFKVFLRSPFNFTPAYLSIFPLGCEFSP